MTLDEKIHQYAQKLPHSFQEVPPHLTVVTKPIVEPSEA